MTVMIEIRFARCPASRSRRNGALWLQPHFDVIATEHRAKAVQTLNNQFKGTESRYRRFLFRGLTLVTKAIEVITYTLQEHASEKKTSESGHFSVESLRLREIECGTKRPNWTKQDRVQSKTSRTTEGNRSARGKWTKKNNFSLMVWWPNKK